MEKFIHLDAIAAPLPIINVDTDMIIPKQFLKTIKRTGLGANLFDEMRFKDDGSENPDFILNQEPYRHAGILIAGENFGCGSSREHAPWSLLDFGIRCIIAPSFADIFLITALRMAFYPLPLPQEQIDELMKHAGSDNPKLSVDLEEQTIRVAGSNQSYGFEVDPFRKKCLLNGLDDIGLTLQKEKAITAFEAKDHETRSWLYQSQQA